MNLISKINCFYLLTKSAEKSSAGYLFLCLEDNTALLVKRGEEMSSPNLWTLPGGRADKDDDSEYEVAAREVLEELNTIPKNKQLLGSHHIKTDKHSYYVYIFNLTKQEKLKFSKNIKLDEENQKYKWFNIKHLPEQKDCHLDLSWIPKKLEQYI